MQIDRKAFCECYTAEAWENIIERLYPSGENARLNLRKCSLRDQNAISLFDYLDRNPVKFHVIDLSQNGLTDVTALKIAQVITQNRILCNFLWIGNKIDLKENAITSVGVKACYEAIRTSNRQPDFFDFNRNLLINPIERKQLNDEYLQMKKNQDPILRFFTWLNSFFDWS